MFNFFEESSLINSADALKGRQEPISLNQKHYISGRSLNGPWEDYDFWCKLVEKGFFGVQSPTVQAIYRAHSNAMSHIATNRSWKALSRTLNERHEWLTIDS